MGWIRILLLFTATLSGMAAQAQTWSEWFSQKKTQQKYLLEQLAALKLYAGYLKKGYEIGRSGLGFIKDASKGELDLHSTFFSSLKYVSPAIKNNVKVAEIIQMQLDVSSAFTHLLKSPQLAESHQRFVELVRKDILADCLIDMEELLMVVTSARAELTDDERIIRIDAVHKSMQGKRNFVFGFARDAWSLSAQSAKELEILKRMEELYENR